VEQIERIVDKKMPKKYNTYKDQAALLRFNNYQAMFTISS